MSAHEEFNKIATRYPPQKGTWTLTAPDGRKWEGETPLSVVGQEQRERIPPSLALERIYRALQEESPAQETSALCPHGMPRAENVCGPCSEGRPNRKETGTVPTVTTIERCPNCGVLTNDPRHMCTQV
jgi:hypothetical protein